MHNTCTNTPLTASGLKKNKLIPTITLISFGLSNDEICFLYIHCICEFYREKKLDKEIQDNKVS